MVNEYAPETHRENGDPSADKLEDAIAEYVERLTSGESLDRLDILAENPGFGDKILQALHDFVDLNPQAEKVSLGTLGDYTLRRPDRTWRHGRGVRGVAELPGQAGGVEGLAGRYRC